MNRKKAYTLLETITVIFILLCIFCGGVTLYKSGKNIKNGILMKKYTYEIQNIITFGKCVCRDKGKVGKITIDTSRNTIRFMEGYDGIERVIKIPKDFIVTPKINYYISEEGKIKGSNTIRIADKNKKINEITIKTGVDTITIYEN